MIKKYIATHFFESSSESESSSEISKLIQFTDKLHLHEGLIKPIAVKLKHGVVFESPSLQVAGIKRGSSYYNLMKKRAKQSNPSCKPPA